MRSRLRLPSGRVPSRSVPDAGKRCACCRTEYVAPMARGTLIHETGEPVGVALSSAGAPLVPMSELEARVGWELRPEGLCRAGVCVPVPPERHASLVASEGRDVNVAELADLCRQPVAHDAEHHVWVVGSDISAPDRTAIGRMAPEFALPDLIGVEHRLSDFRGSKVLLLSWASW